MAADTTPLYRSGDAKAAASGFHDIVWYLLGDQRLRALN